MTTVVQVMSRNFIRQAVESANLNVLRIALYQATGDEAFAKFRVEQLPVLGGSSMVLSVHQDDRAKMIELATRYLCKKLIEEPPPPTESEAKHLLESFAGRPVNDAELQLSIDQLAFDENMRIVNWSAEAPRSEAGEKFSVLIIGAGFGGIAAAIPLLRLGIPFTIIDRQQGFGGTWMANEYPDIRVDAPSHLYQFMSEKGYAWKNQYARGAEVQGYLDTIAAKHGLKEHFHGGVEIKSAKWQEAGQYWELHGFKNGEPYSAHANVVISAAGLFNRPLIPNIPGLDIFEGPCFHTTAWPADIDISQTRFAVIGTGSSGAQLVPRIAQTAKHVSVFQRTPHWVAPVEGYQEPVDEGMRWLMNNVPNYWNWYGFTYHWQSIQNLPGLQIHDPQWQARGGKINERNDKLRAFLTSYIREKLDGDEELIAKCIPDYAPWVRRMVMDNGWYEALRQPNVDLINCGIKRITKDGIVDSEGTHHAADAIVLSTGFAAEEFLWPVRYEGREGMSLEELWSKDGARAYLGMTMPNFPNLFVLYGPSAQPRSSSLIKWMEVWSRYAAQAIVALIEGGHGSVEVKSATFDSYNEKLDEATKPIIWESQGKKSYYVNSHGRSNVNMPWESEEYYVMSRTFNPEDYQFK